MASTSFINCHGPLGDELYDIDPQLYLTQLLVNLPSARTSELPTWLPDQWMLDEASRSRNL
jgi:hypothetical protein